MKKQLISAMTAVICMVSAIPCNVSAEEEEDLSVYAEQVWEIVNEERAKEGLEPLVFSPELNEVADVRAEELKKLYSHTRPDGSDCSTALTERNITFDWRGENITAFSNMGSDIAGIAMDGWMHSDGHRRNILKEEYNNIGVGVSYQDGYYYLVQVFCGNFVDWDLSGGVLTIKDGSGVMPIGTRKDRPWHEETENITEVLISDNITCVNEWAFAECTNLKEVTIPADVTEVCNYAFYECNALEEIIFLNPDCIIGESNLTIPENTTICGYDDSTAQEYAAEKGYTFRSLGEVPPEPEEVAGDANNDGKFSVADLVTLYNWLSGSGELENWTAADLNNDSKIDIFDLTMMRQMFVNQ